MQKHQTQKFQRISPFGIAPVKINHIRLGHARIVDHSVDLSIPHLKKKSILKKGMGRSNNFFKYYINA